MNKIKKNNTSFNIEKISNSSAKKSRIPETITEKKSIEVWSFNENSDNHKIDEPTISFKNKNNEKIDYRLINAGGYNYDNIQKILQNECKYSQNGSIAGLAYENDVQLINDLSKLEQLYANFPNFRYYNQTLYDESYSSYTISKAGCCPTSLAMILTYLTGDEILPTDLTDEMDKYCYSEGTDVTGDCFPEVCSKYNINAKKLNWTDENEIRNSLENNNPIILNVNKGDFTSSGHFIVLLGLDQDGNVIVADPNNINTSAKTYSINRLIEQTNPIEAACWSFELE